ncbi:MAG: carbon-nitrogen family hydrolase [Planctomycetota bacterium]
MCGIQFDIAWEDPVENFQLCTPLLSQAAEIGARLVVLPEMFATGFSMDAEKIAAFSEDTVRFLSERARELGIWVLGGFAEPHSPMPRNVCALFDPSGREQLRYHKIHPFTLAGEDRRFTPGDEICTFELEGVRVTPFICYDLRFPELFRLAATETDLFVVVANWPKPRDGAWRKLLAARAIENQCYVLGVNRVGESDGKQYRGDSGLLDPMGNWIASASYQAALVSGEVVPQNVQGVRRSLSFLSDRRTDLYRSLEEKQGSQP